MNLALDPFGWCTHSGWKRTIAPGEADTLNCLPFSEHLMTFGREALSQSAFRIAQQCEVLAGKAGSHWSNEAEIARAWFNVWQALDGGDQLDGLRSDALVHREQVLADEQRCDEASKQISALFTVLRKSMEQVREHFYVGSRIVFGGRSNGQYLTPFERVEFFQPMKTTREECHELVRAVRGELKDLAFSGIGLSEQMQQFWLKPERRTRFAIDFKESVAPTLDRLESELNKLAAAEASFAAANSALEQCCRQADEWWSRSRAEASCMPYATFNRIVDEIEKGQSDEVRGTV